MSRSGSSTPSPNSGASRAEDENISGEESSAEVKKTPRRYTKLALPRPRHPVWENFKKTDVKDTYQCVHCSAKIRAVNATRTGLLAHMKMHANQAKKYKQNVVKTWLVAGMVAVLHIPLNVFNSIFIKILFWLARLGTINDKIARGITDGEAKRCRDVLIKDLRELRENGAVLSLTADEWTWRRKRFLGITLHCSQTIPCLFSRSIALLSRFRDKATAENLQETLLEALDSIGLKLDDIRGITTDAAPVMIKLGDELKELAGSRPFYHQLCYAHGIHLAVMDILENDMLDTKSLLQRHWSKTSGGTGPLVDWSMRQRSLIMTQRKNTLKASSTEAQSDG